MAGGGAPGRPCPDRSGAEKRARAAPGRRARARRRPPRAVAWVVSTGTAIEAKALRAAPRRGCWDRSPAKIVMSHMNAASPRQSLVKGERLTRYELAAVMAAGRLDNRPERTGRT